MAGEYRQVTVGKFIFRVKSSYLYTQDGLWLAPPVSAGAVRVGLSDYRQQASGDAAFVELPAVGQALRSGDDLANVETVKVDLTVPAPCDAVVTAVNEALNDAPERINQDPYGTGWLVELKRVYSKLVRVGAGFSASMESSPRSRCCDIRRARVNGGETRPYN